MHVVVLMDPLSVVHPDEDTTFQLMLALLRRDHHVYHLAPGDLSWRDGRIMAEVTPILAMRRVLGDAFTVGQRLRLDQAAIDMVLVRTDPPFSERYLRDTWLLDLLPPRVVVVNRPVGLRTVSEKLWCLRFADLMPPTLVTRQLADFEAFLAEQGRVVLKPVDGYGGDSVFICHHGDGNARVAFQTLGQRGKREVLVQRYLIAAEGIERRLLLLDGELLGIVARIRTPGDHRHLDVDETVLPQPDAADLAIMARLGPELRSLGLLFVGLDVIGGCLIEVNVTSPTCLQELVRASGIAYDDRIVAHLERLVHRQHDLQP
jgi:glutathione synthase